MQFSNEVINNKERYLDDILTEKERIEVFLGKNIHEPYTIKAMKKIWNGGGATLFRLKGAGIDAVLKVKNRNILVESKLEEEKGFINESALYHENKMILCAKEAGVNVPQVYCMGHDDKYDYLVTEYIDNDLFSELNTAKIDYIIILWKNLEENVRKLYEHGIVHTDVHEYNIRVKKGKIYLLDFEEARILKQKVAFEESLDYIGYNKESTVGLFPYYIEEEYKNPYTCLDRMREVFNKIMAKKILDFAVLCNYDSQNGICNALDHGRDSRIYQAINNEYLAIDGQRSGDDRPCYIEAVCDSLFDQKNFCYIDIGSNNGYFCRQLSKYYGKSCRYIGLEGTHNYNELAKGVSFLEKIDNVEYSDFVCGKDSMKKLEINGTCMVTIYSVWHHIVEKEKFLDELKTLDIKGIMLEMPTQYELYKGGSWQSEIQFIKEYLGFKGEYFIAFSKDYNRPIVLVTPNVLTQTIIECIDNNIYKQEEKMKAENSLNEMLLKNYKEYVERKKKTKKKYIICYGAGSYGKKAMDFIGGENIICYIDNNKKKTGFSAHPVITQDDLMKIIDNDTLLVISMCKKNGLPIKTELESNGIKNIMFLDDMLETGYIKKWNKDR